MKYFFAPFTWREAEGAAAWCPPDGVHSIIDLRSLAQCAKAGGPSEGYALCAAERDLQPGEILVAEHAHTGLDAERRDRISKVLNLGETLQAVTVPAMIEALLGIYSDPDVGLLCPPLVPDHRGRLRFTLGDISFRRRCPTSGAQWSNILKVFHQQYRTARAEGGDLHRKFLHAWSRTLRVRNYEVFIPADLPNESPKRPTTTLIDTFQVGNHTDLAGQASSQGWLWAKLAGSTTALYRTNTTSDAECAIAFGARCVYRGESDLSLSNHYVQGDLRTNSDQLRCGLLARASSSDQTYYEVMMFSGTDNLRIHKYAAGTPTNIANRSVAMSVGVQYAIRLEVDGDILQVWFNGAQQGADITDTSIPGNTRCGMSGEVGGSLTNTGGVANYEAGDFLTPSQVYAGLASRKNLTRRTF